VSECPDEVRRRELRDQDKADHAAPPEGRPLTYGRVLSFSFVVAVYSAVVGGAVGALTLVRRGLVPHLREHGSWLDLAWVVAGAVVGAGLVFLYRRLWKKELETKAGTTTGAVAGALVVAPAGVLAGILPPAAAFGGLALIGCVLAVPLLDWAVGRRSLLPWIVAGTIFGAYVGAFLRLSVSVLDVSKGALHGEVGRAFHELLAHLRANGLDLWMLIAAALGSVAGGLLLWRLHVEQRAKKALP
jgi:hypothetical protein